MLCIYFLLFKKINLIGSWLFFMILPFAFSQKALVKILTISVRHERVWLKIGINLTIELRAHSSTSSAFRRHHRLWNTYYIIYHHYSIQTVCWSWEIIIFTRYQQLYNAWTVNLRSLCPMSIQKPLIFKLKQLNRILVDTVDTILTLYYCYYNNIILIIEYYRLHYNGLW